MINETQIQQVIGTTAIDADGDKIGKVSEVYLDDETGRPEWATVHTGLFGTKETFVPLAQAELSGEQLRFPYDKAKVKDAPKVDTDGHLSPQEEQELYRYYGLGGGTTTETTSQTTTGTAGMAAGTAGTAGMAAETAGRTDRDGDGVYDDVAGRTVGHDTSGPTTDEAMTRSEERLNVGTRSEEVGRARLRKYVVTENVTETVPVSREEVRVEREPITDANVGNAMDGPAISEEEHEVTLHAERPVVEKEAVPVERVRLDKQTVTDQERVSEDVRKEEIEVDDGTGVAGNALDRDNDGRIGR
ncbi:DUF2382 domain-containing protein [Geodermatophilus obscurus]|uniref:Uncharacterized protein n=1 Tax=Geodermatophilus obscurus (strain ATCC 25078 / DSM 43160 / JCM 3152 / CCUG 61914 / KCC A-0152 / KCTC 9177 / NBRC 13315 / NRRL B-3577 / G-20) TaxID=526225 RepID=D2S4T7_GEOOG|nr:PRC and DUF2382 domain-containing protein [Geodermatophilus obscurus]ADB77237.1 Domain of unknown function DUF2382-like protein [Geodermatophilus obscurus DSM 43160]